MTYSLIGPRVMARREGSNEYGLSVLLFGSFLGIGYLVFSGLQHGVRGPCGVLHDRARFFENNIFAPKMAKISQAYDSLNV